MRLVGTLSNENHARRLAGYLKSKSIDTKCEVAFHTNGDTMSYQIWVLDEDRLQEAASDFARFVSSPAAAEFDAPILALAEPEPPREVLEEEEEEEEPEVRARPRAPLTTFLLALCAMVFFLNYFQEETFRAEGLSEETFFITPIQSLLLYDVPQELDALEETILKNVPAPNQRLREIPPSVQSGIDALEKVSIWRGGYDWFILKMQGKDTALAEGPLFSRIRNGEIWRLFSPCILHTQLFHILFNMIWLWVLGRPIEQRIGFVKTILLTLIGGVVSNLAQYLISGPFFLGYSGIVMTLAGFIWSRQRIAPWEGYPLNRATILFLLLFVGSMFMITFVSFFIESFANFSLAPNIANTAHIAGALTGFFLGRLPFFSWKMVAK
jgi:GlpG protein